MGSIGRDGQAHGQAENGYNAGKWDLFNIDKKLDNIQKLLDKANKKKTYNAFNDAWKEAKAEYESTKKFFDNNPEPDIMSNNQVQEQKELSKRLADILNNIKKSRKNFTNNNNM